MNNRVILFIVALVVIMVAGNALMVLMNHVLGSPVYVRLAASGAMAAALVYFFLETCLKMLAISGAVGAGAGLAVSFTAMPLLECVNLAIVLFMGVFLLTRLSLFFYDQWRFSGMSQFIRGLFR